MTFSKHILFIIPIIFIASCNSTDAKKIFTYKVKTGEFVSTVTANGTVKAKKSVTIPCPNIWPQPKINWLKPEGEFVVKDEIICKMDASEVILNHQKSMNELETMKAEHKKSQADLELNRAVLESQIKTVEASVEISRLQMKKLEYVSPVQKKQIELEVERSEIEKSKIQKKLMSLKLIEQTEFTQMKMQLIQAENKVKQAQESLDKLTIKSPVDGVVVYAQNWITDKKVQEGDALFPGMPILEIPATDALQVKLQVNETYIKKITQGQPVKIKIDAHPHDNITGKVAKVASMGKPINRDSKIKVFEVDVNIDSTSADIQVGVSTTCEIFAKSISDTIAIPMECIFEQDSSKIVYIQDGSKFRAQPIETGAVSENWTVVTQGLAGGEELAIIEPSDNLIKK